MLRPKPYPTKHHGFAHVHAVKERCVLPEDVSGTGAVLEFLAKEISVDTCLNLMDQYWPCYRADENPPLDRLITRSEYSRARARAAELGLHRFA